MKSLVSLWREAADELAAWCCTSASRDFKKLASRTEYEGTSFLTITLPSFGKDFERGLERGRIDPSDYMGFERNRRNRGPLPLFLGGFLDQVFSPVDGQLLQEPSLDCIFAVRQLTSMFGKILLETSKSRKAGAIERYLECEQEIRETAVSITEEEKSSFARVAALLWSDVFSTLERRLIADAENRNPLLPGHGPGATADRLTGNGKYDQLEWPQRWDGLFPYEEFALAILPSSHDDERMNRVDFLEPEAERPVKVITVPKTLKTPRIIAIEPTCMQYMQQALLDPFVEELERDAPPLSLWESSIASSSVREKIRPVRNDMTTSSQKGHVGHLPSHFVGFTDQDPNRILARIGSKYGHLATLDLSEASDRVGVWHVDVLLSRWPLLREAVMAVRSSKASVPSFRSNDDQDLVIELAKYASMGSALCFPMEALVFTTSVFVGVERALNRPLTHKDISGLVGKVRVYGDDIIIPAEYVRSVIGTLESLGFKVNSGKSFWNGKFRESCGGDYYDGMDVTPIRVRRPLPVSRSDAQEVISLVELRNQFYWLGMWQTAGWLDRMIARVLPRFPIVEPTSPLLGRNSVSFAPSASGWDAELHHPLIKGFAVHSKPPASKASGEGALLKFFLKRGREPFHDKEHLERQGRPRSVSIKARWARPW